MTLDYRHVILLVTLAGGLSATFLAQPFAQPVEYHHFADQRALGALPHAADVLSNLAFILAGLTGLWQMRGKRHTLPSPLDSWLSLYCVSLIATGGGSMVYHLMPTTPSLFWDRLPMTVTFSLFFCLVLASHIGVSTARKILWPILVTGALATLYWRTTELQLQGDLRFYAAFQFLPLLLVLLMLWLFESRWLSQRWLTATVMAYGAAKLCEQYDAELLQLTGFISGHSLKHLIAALGAWWVVRSAFPGKIRCRTISQNVFPASSHANNRAQKM